MGNIVKKEGELDKMLTPWDSDSIIMMDVDCFERGCACTASNWAAGHRPECVAVIEYKPWVGLTDDEGMAIANWQLSGNHPLRAVIQAIEAKLKEKNGG